MKLINRQFRYLKESKYFRSKHGIAYTVPRYTVIGEGLFKKCVYAEGYAYYYYARYHLRDKQLARKSYDAYVEHHNGKPWVAKVYLLMMRAYDAISMHRG